MLRRISLDVRIGIREIFKRTAVSFLKRLSCDFQHKAPTCSASPQPPMRSWILLASSLALTAAFSVPRDTTCYPFGYSVNLCNAYWKYLYASIPYFNDERCPIAQLEQLLYSYGKTCHAAYTGSLLTEVEDYYTSLTTYVEQTCGLTIETLPDCSAGGAVPEPPYEIPVLMNDDDLGRLCQSSGNVYQAQCLEYCIISYGVVNENSCETLRTTIDNGVVNGLQCYLAICSACVQDVPWIYYILSADYGDKLQCFVDEPSSSLESSSEVSSESSAESSSEASSEVSSESSEISSESFSEVFSESSSETLLESSSEFSESFSEASSESSSEASSESFFESSSESSSEVSSESSSEVWSNSSSELSSEASLKSLESSSSASSEAFSEGSSQCSFEISSESSSEASTESAESFSEILSRSSSDPSSGSSSESSSEFFLETSETSSEESSKSSMSSESVRLSLSSELSEFFWSHPLDLPQSPSVYL